MRRRIVALVFVVTALALLLLAVPLAADVNTRIRNDKRSELARVAALAAADISVNPNLGNDPIELPSQPSSLIVVGVYSATGHRVAGAGPGVLDRQLGSIRPGIVSEADTGRDMVVAVPVAVEEQLRAVVRAAEPASAIRRAVRVSWLRIAMVAVVALILATAVAVALANRLLRPLRRLHDFAVDMGSVPGRRPQQGCGIAEIDEIASALNISAQRIDESMQRERSFSADVSHQLRTPITGLRLTLENELEHPTGHPAVLREAVGTVDRLEATIEGLLLLARDAHHPRTGDCTATLTERAQRWQRDLASEGRALRYEPGPDPIVVAMSNQAIGEIVDVLVNNARLHATGTVTLSVKRRSGFVTITIADEGPGLDDPSAVFRRRDTSATGTGIGLALARRLAEAEGAQLVLGEHTAFCRFELIIPA